MKTVLYVRIVPGVVVPALAWSGDVGCSMDSPERLEALHNRTSFQSATRTHPHAQHPFHSKVLQYRIRVVRTGPFRYLRGSNPNFRARTALLRAVVRCVSMCHEQLPCLRYLCSWETASCCGRPCESRYSSKTRPESVKLIRTRRRVQMPQPKARSRRIRRPKKTIDRMTPCTRTVRWPPLEFTDIN